MMHSKAKNILALLDARSVEAEGKKAKMAIRRVLLDGVKIVEPYRRALVHEATRDTKDKDHLLHEAQLMRVWVQMARVLALKLKRSAVGKTRE